MLTPGPKVAGDAEGRAKGEARLQRDAQELELADREIASAACCGVDMIWGYADVFEPGRSEQSRQIALARENIRVALLMAVRGQKLEMEAIDVSLG